MDTRIRTRTGKVSFAALAFACVVAATAAPGCARDSEQSPASRPISAAEAKLVAQAPAISKNSFGTNVFVNSFKPAFLFSEARAIGDTMYITYNTEISPYKRIATLYKGVLHPIRLSRDYYQISFENGNRVISAVGPQGGRDWYELQAAQAIPVAAPASPVYGVPLHVLADGDSCVEGMDGTPSALDEIRAHRRVSILSQAAFLRATNGVMTRVTQANCDHFRGNNYVTMDAPGVIVRLNGDHATVLTAGWIEAANERHLLIEASKVMIDVDAR